MFFITSNNKGVVIPLNANSTANKFRETISNKTIRNFYVSDSFQKISLTRNSCLTGYKWELLLRVQRCFHQLEFYKTKFKSAWNDNHFSVQVNVYLAVEYTEERKLRKLHTCPKTSSFTVNVRSRISCISLSFIHCKLWWNSSSRYSRSLRSQSLT